MQTGDIGWDIVESDSTDPVGVRFDLIDAALVGVTVCCSPVPADCEWWLLNRNEEAVDEVEDKLDGVGDTTSELRVEFIEVGA